MTISLITRNDPVCLCNTVFIINTIISHYIDDLSYCTYNHTQQQEVRVVLTDHLYIITEGWGCPLSIWLNLRVPHTHLELRLFSPAIKTHACMSDLIEINCFVTRFLSDGAGGGRNLGASDRGGGGNILHCLISLNRCPNFRNNVDPPTTAQLPVGR